MSEFFKKLLKNAIVPIYNNLIALEEISENEYELSLPMFLNTGNAIDLIIEKREGDVLIVKNRLHYHVENALKKNINFINLRKNYLNGNKKIDSLKEEFIIKNGINDSLLQEKIIKYNSFDEIGKEIFEYTYYVIRFYNYLYDYINIYLKPEQSKDLFKEEIERFVKEFNSKNNLCLNIINKESIPEIGSENNQYYIDKKESYSLTGINNRVQFLEAVNDLKIIKKVYGVDNIIVVQNKNGKNKLSEEYMKRFLTAKFNYFSSECFQEDEIANDEDGIE